MLQRLALAAIAALMLAVPASATAADPITEICPHVGFSPNPSCVTQPIPGEGWTVAAVARPDAKRMALYKSLIPSFYKLPKEPMLGFTMARLDVPGTPGGSDADPGEGYMEGSFFIRVAHGAEEGWFPLATPVNDESQYDFGRMVGIPKWMADVHIRHEGDAWNTWATPPGKENDLFMRLRWTPGVQQAPASSARPSARRRRASRRHCHRGHHHRRPQPRRHYTRKRHCHRVRSRPPRRPATTMVDPSLRPALEKLTLFDEPMFSLVRPWDENDPDKFPERVKFTVSPLVPVATGADSPYTKRPDPVIGTTAVTVSHTVGPKSLPIWKALLGPGEHKMLGSFWHGAGFVFVSSERLDGQPGPPGEQGTGP